LRRGEGVPQLADAALMQQALLPQNEFVDPADVVLEDDGDEVDGLGVLRAVVGAWQSLESQFAAGASSHAE
jgi:hypothetical protein